MDNLRVTNFGKDIREMNEDELFQMINNNDPQYGVVCQYELMRRLSIKSEQSSERFSKASFYLALAAILVSIGIGTVQIYLTIIGDKTDSINIGHQLLSCLF